MESEAAANRAHLLAGRETAWYDLATRRLGAHPFEARALFAHVARSESAGETRRSAQLQLVFSLRQGGLDLAALHLFRAESASPDTIDPQARFLLGDSAESKQLPALAARWWGGMAAPPGTDETDWPLRVAAARWRAGATEEAMGVIRAILMRDGPIQPAAEARVTALAREMRDAGAMGSAEDLLVRLLPRVGAAKAREVLLSLGEIAEATGRYPVAADYFLRAALSGDSTRPDAAAIRARTAAAANLARAGFRDDARAQYEWLLKNVRDPVQREAARRELARP